MRLQVRHQTAYHYASPIHYAIQTLRLTPRPHEGLGVIRWRVRGEGRGPLPSFVDGFGNLAHTHTVNHPHDSAAVFVEGAIKSAKMRAKSPSSEAKISVKAGPSFFSIWN